LRARARRRDSYRSHHPRPVRQGGQARRACPPARHRRTGPAREGRAARQRRRRARGHADPDHRSRRGRRGAPGPRSRLGRV